VKIKSNLLPGKRALLIALLSVLLVLPCSAKNSLQQLLNVETTTPVHSKATSLCQLLTVAEVVCTNKVAVTNARTEESGIPKFIPFQQNISLRKTFVKKYSVPLYILYRQLRSNLIL